MLPGKVTEVVERRLLWVGGKSRSKIIHFGKGSWGGKADGAKKKTTALQGGGQRPVIEKGGGKSKKKLDRDIERSKCQSS